MYLRPISTEGSAPRTSRARTTASFTPTLGEQLVPLERRGLVLDLATQALERQTISVARWREVLRLGPFGDWRLILEERHVTLDAEHRLAAAH